MSDQPSKPRRRWFRFSLRTLFVAVTICSLLIRFAPDISVGQRRQFLRKQIEKNGGVVIPFSNWQNYFQQKVTPPTELSWIRKWMGDETIAEIWLPLGTPQPEIDRVRATFPEAISCNARPRWLRTILIAAGQRPPTECREMKSAVKSRCLILPAVLFRCREGI